MRLTRASSYALQALAFMAAQKEPETPVASHESAKAQGIPERFLLKVLKPLVSAQILHSIRGPGGGYRLARSPAKISLLQVIEAIDGPIRGQAPLLQGGNSRLDHQLAAICNQAAEQLRKRLQKISLGDLVGK
jgi:Rrf2 family protein